MSAKTLYAGSSTGKLFLDRRKFYIKEQEVAELWPSETPFSTLLANTTQIRPDDALFKMFEHESAFIKQRFVYNGTASIPNNDTGVAIVAASIGSIEGLNSTVDSSYVGLECEVWDTTETTKKGVCFFSAFSTNLTAKLLGTTAISVVAGDVFHVIGNVRAEGSEAGEAWADELSVVYNSTQFFSVPVEITGRLYRASLRGYSNELARLRMEKAKEYKMQQEHAFLKGGSVIGTGMDGTAFADSYRSTTDGAVRTTMGIIPVIETYGSATATDDAQNRFTITEATYSYKNFVDDMEKVFQYEPGGGEKFAFCGPGAMSYWSKLDSNVLFAGKSGWRVNISETKKNSLGFNVRMLETPHGILHLVPTKALKYMYNKYMVIVDHSNLFHAVYEPNSFRHNIKTDNDYDGIKDVYRGDKGIGVTLQKAHQLFKIQ